MPDKSRKSYMTLVNNLESLADGAKLHNAEAGYPSEIAEENLRTIKQELMDIREQCVLAAAEASKQQQIYDDKEQEVADKVARYKTIVYGLYGKKSREVRDFGLRPYKERANSKAAEEETTQAM